MTERASALLTDLYQINMMQAYLDHGRRTPRCLNFSSATCRPAAVFSSPPDWSRRSISSRICGSPPAEIDWLKSTGRFGQNLLDYLAEFRFTGDVHAMPEGTVFFANEPILRVTAPLPQAQLVESRLINILHFQTLIASKAARMMLAAPGKVLVDFGCAARTAPRPD